MLIQNDPFRDFDALFGRLGRSSNGSVAMPMDAFRRGSDVWVQIDLPGVAADSLDITVERSVLTVSAERSWQREEGDQVYLAERHRGTYRRQVHLGEGLDAEHIEADFTRVSSLQLHLNAIEPTLEFLVRARVKHLALHL